MIVDSPRSLLLVKMATTLLVSVLVPLTLKGQDTEWKYNRSKDAITDKVSDQLLLQGRYLSATPSAHDDGAPAIGLSCSNGKMDGFAILTGVVLETRPNSIFGTTIGTVTTIRTRIDSGKPRTDRAANVAQDFKALKFKNLYLIGGNDVFFAKKFIVAVDSRGTLEMEFDIPPDSSPVEKYCGIKRKGGK